MFHKVDNQIYFLVDLEQIHPGDTSSFTEFIRHQNPHCELGECYIYEGLTIGTLYEATQELKNLFIHQVPYIEPILDRYGFWVSGVVPVVDHLTGETIAVIGIDFTAWSWIRILVLRMIFPIILVIFFVCLTILSIKINHSKLELMHRSNRLKIQRDILSKFTLNEEIARLDNDSTLNMLIQILVDTLKVDESTVWLLSDSKASYYCKTNYKAISKTYSKKSDLIISKHKDFFDLLTINNITFESNVSSNKLLSDFYSKRGSTIPKSLIYVNIWSNAQIIGIVTVKTEKTYKQWQLDEISFLETVSSIISLVLSKKEKERAEQALIQSNNRFENTLESMTEGYIYLENGKDIKYINKQAYNLFDLDIDYIPQNDIFNYLPYELSKLLRAISSTATETGDVVTQNEYIDDLNKWIEFRAYPSFNDVSMFFIDSTKKKQSEEAQLENQKLSALGELANKMSHDFNNYLNIILANLEMINQKVSKENEISEQLNVIYLTTLDILTRVQLLKRFTGNKSNVSQFEKINVNEIISEAIAQSTSVWKTKPLQRGIHITINENIQPVPETFGNKNELRSVFYNLIKNSVEACIINGEITISTGADADFVYVTISDTGVGMKNDVSTKIFEPFFTTKGQDKGKGLGLVDVKNIISEHEGTINVVSTHPEKGTEIEIILPIREIPIEPEIMHGEQRKESPTILWIDDEEDIREIGSEMLSFFGQNVILSACGIEAMDILSQNDVDIIITDIGMPNMNGWELLEKIETKYPNKYKKAVVSGWGDLITDEQKEKNKVDAVLGKPINIDQLRKLIKQLWA